MGYLPADTNEAEPTPTEADGHELADFRRKYDQLREQFRLAFAFWTIYRGHEMTLPSRIALRPDEGELWDEAFRFWRGEARDGE